MTVVSTNHMKLIALPLLTKWPKAHRMHGACALLCSNC